MNKKTLTILTLILILSIAGAVWFFFFRNVGTTDTTGGVGSSTGTSSGNGFAPYNRGSSRVVGGNDDSGTLATSTTSSPETAIRLPVLRKIYDKPVGGLGATSTASSSLVRFIDRGTGYVYEADSLSPVVMKLSNTSIPRTYESFWNKSLKNFIIRTVKEGDDKISTLYAELIRIIPEASKTVVKKTATATSTARLASSTQASATTIPDQLPITTTVYETRGRYLTENIVEMALSPKGDQIFELVLENDRGVGYVSSFDERTRRKVFDSPMTQLNIEWPEENTIILETKASAYTSGYVYTLNPKTGSFRKIMGDLKSLSAKMSRDGSTLLYSLRKTDNTMGTFIKKMKDGSVQESVLRTLPEKCVWGTVQKYYVYCAVPNRFPDGAYPDDWYTGKTAFVDQIWRMDSRNGEVHLLANPVIVASALIDVTNLTLDPKESFLYFINKRDLSLWSLDLTEN